MKKLEGNTATLGLTNVSSITIKISEDGESVQYQFNNGNESDEIKEALISYKQGDEEDGTLYPVFHACDGNCYFLYEFLRDNY